MYTRDIGLKSRPKSPILTYPTSIWRPICGDPVGIFRTGKVESMGYRMALFA